MPTPDAPYEPWHPTPGQRVRVRRSLECPSGHHITSLCDDGHTGKVVSEPPGRPLKPPAGRHPYLVFYDHPIPTGIAQPPYIVAMRYAAAELEPEGAPDPGDGSAYAAALEAEDD